MQPRSGFAQKERCEPSPAAFGGGPPYKGDNNVCEISESILPLVRGRAAEGGRGWLTPHFLCKAALANSREGIDRFLIAATCVGIRPSQNGMEVYAPNDLSLTY